MTPPPKGPLLRRLKAAAQRLQPVVRLGKSGPTDAFYAALDAALQQHELVKIKFEEFKGCTLALVDRKADRLKHEVELANRINKMHLYHMLQMDLNAALDFAAASQPILITSEDSQEAINAFMEKREGVFKGR